MNKSGYRPFPALHRVLKFGTLLLLAIGLAACSGESSIQLSDDDIAQNNRGVALMGRFEYANAADVFQPLVERHPEWHDARTNYAIAVMNRQEADDGRLALAELAKVLEASPDDLRAHYAAGLMRLYLGEIEEAAVHFEAVVALDDSDAYAHYYLGRCHLRMGDPEAALVAYDTAIALDPYLRSSYYSAAQVLQQLGRSDEATAKLQEFERFANNPSARLAEFKYSRMGPKSMAVAIGPDDQDDTPLALPEGELFGESRVAATLDWIAIDTNLTTVDVDHDGAQDLFIAVPAGSRMLTPGPNGTLVDHANQPFARVTGINAVAWGDVNNDELVDAYLCRKGTNQLWLQESIGQWRQAGPDANVGDGENDCADVAMVDADHDGDLDILVGNRGAADVLLNNNRDGTFRSLADRLGSAAEVRDTHRVISADIDSDRDVDLLFINEQPPHTVLINDRQWNYKPAEGLQDFVNAQLGAAAAADLDANGLNELIGVEHSGAVRVWRSDGNGNWQSDTIHQSSSMADSPGDLAVLDLNGNGQVELALLGPGTFEVIGVHRDGQADQLTSKSFDGDTPIPVLLSVSNGSSLLAVSRSAGESTIAEWPPGPGRFSFTALALSGKHDDAETMRSNASGIGTKVSLRTGSRWTLTDTHKHASMRGHSLQPVSIGLGNASKADFVALLWSDGVFQTELDLDVGSIHSIAEIERQLGSCPVLFAWNGERFEFVTDILGVGAMGFLVEPDVLLPPRPWEKVTFAPGSVAELDGKLVFKLTEPMEENAYVDALTLEIYDLPVGWEVVADDRLGTGAPEVTGDALFYKTSLDPVSARDSAGNDVLDSILVRDNLAMAPGDIDRRFLGLLKDHETLTIEFDQPIDRLADNPDAVPVLLTDAWVELPYSQTHFSAWQAGRLFGSTTLEARDGFGAWHRIYPEFGFPGGMPRQMTLPMHDLPPGTDALRLSWNRETYWDRVRVVFAETPPGETQAMSVTPEFARVAKAGFATRTTFEQRRPYYDYHNRVTFRDTLYATGFYTSFGEVTELVTEADDALAIIGPGEEVHMEFDAPPPPSDGFERWYILDTRGWGKDKDLYTWQGETVGPLPRAYPEASDERRDELHRRYNTRFQSGH